MVADDEQMPCKILPETSDDGSQTDQSNRTGENLVDFTINKNYHTTEDKLDALRRMHNDDSEYFSDLLWKFLLGLLLKRDQRCINWTGNDWEFCFNDHEEVARLWGVHKRRPNMTYGKMSRALRFYYSQGIVTKCEEKFTYRFNDDHINALILNDG